ncbi:MAG: SDR family NAD(P)-dependent oxidoreductase [Propionibacteriaceae bacterium]
MTGRRLDGSVAMVTGASSGIGEATARWLSAQGATVALVARRRGRLEQLRSDIVASGGSARVVEADISLPDQAAGVVHEALDELGRLDILVNNAGVMLVGTALEARVEDWDRMVTLNLSALLHVTYAAVPFLIDAVATSGRGVADIVNVGCATGRTASSGSSVYTLTKSAVAGFTESLRQELAARRVRVSVVEPGAVDTELTRQLSTDGHPAAPPPDDVEPLCPRDVAEIIGFIVTRDRRVAINELRVRPSEQIS